MPQFISSPWRLHQASWLQVAYLPPESLNRHKLSGLFAFFQVNYRPRIIQNWFEYYSMVKWEQNRALNPPPRHSITKSFVSIYFLELIFILNNVPGSFRLPRFTFAPSSLPANWRRISHVCRHKPLGRDKQRAEKSLGGVFYFKSRLPKWISISLCFLPRWKFQQFKFGLFCYCWNYNSFSVFSSPLPYHRNPSHLPSLASNVIYS